METKSNTQKPQQPIPAASLLNRKPSERDISKVLASLAIAGAEDERRIMKKVRTFIAITFLIRVRFC